MLRCEAAEGCGGPGSTVGQGNRSFSLCVVGLLLSPPTTIAHVALQSIRSIRAPPRAWRWLELHVGRDSEVALPTEVEGGGAVFTPLDVQHVVLMSMFYNLSLLIEPCAE